jgi:peptidoglycan/LPS O-acetylase OafA/YrhL
MTLPFKILYRCYRFASRRWHWAQWRFTRPGLAVLGAFILVVLLAPDTDNNLTYQALPLLLVLLVAAVCLSRLFKASFAANRVLPRFGTAGCPLNYHVLVKNVSRRGQSGLSLLENLADP